MRYLIVYQNLSIVVVEIFEREVIAICKMSNCTTVGDNEYDISLAIMYMVASKMRNSSMYILSTKPNDSLYLYSFGA